MDLQVHFTYYYVYLYALVPFTAAIDVNCPKSFYFEVMFHYYMSELHKLKLLSKLPTIFDS